MKSTGIVRRIDALGRVVLPIELRRTMQLEPGAAMEMFVDGRRIVLSRYDPACVFCGEADGVLSFLDRRVCRSCRAAIGNSAAAAGIAR